MDVDQLKELLTRVSPEHRQLVGRIALLGMNMPQKKRMTLAKQLIDEILAQQSRENIFRKIVRKITAWF